jgi:hypothetical protein
VPEGGSELGTSVRGDGVRNTKTGNPGGNEGFSTGFGGSGGKRSCFKPSGGVVNDGENVCVALRWRKRANKVNVNVGKMTGRNGWAEEEGRCECGFLLFGKEDIHETID